MAFRARSIHSGVPEGIREPIEDPADLRGAFLAAKRDSLVSCEEQCTRFSLPLVNDQQVIKVQLNSEDQTNNKQTVRDDGGRRGRFWPKGVKDEALDIIRQSSAFLKGIPGTVEEGVSHPIVV